MHTVAEASAVRCVPRLMVPARSDSVGMIASHLEASGYFRCDTEIAGTAELLAAALQEVGPDIRFRFIET